MDTIDLRSVRSSTVLIVKFFVLFYWIKIYKKFVLPKVLFLFLKLLYQTRADSGRRLEQPCNTWWHPTQCGLDGGGVRKKDEELWCDATSGSDHSVLANICTQILSDRITCQISLPVLGIAIEMSNIISLIWPSKVHSHRIFLSSNQNIKTHPLTQCIKWCWKPENK